MLACEEAARYPQPDCTRCRRRQLRGAAAPFLSRSCTTVHVIIRRAPGTGWQHYRRALLDACTRHDVAVEAYNPLGTGRPVADTTVAKIARQNGRTPAQVLLRWSLQHGLKSRL